MTVRLADAMEGALLRSPTYRAAMVPEAVTPEDLNEARHLPLLGIEQVALLNVPADVLVHKRLPEGLLPPLTIAVQETKVLPTTTDEWLQVTVVVVEGRNDWPP